MDSQQIKIAAIAVVILIAIVVVFMMRQNVRKTSLKEKTDKLNYRFNSIKTVPLAFKLNKAQAMARRSKETSEQVDVYYQKYERAQKNIDAIAACFEDLEDAISYKRYRDAEEVAKRVEAMIEDGEKEVKEIDVFLEQFSEKENQQREYSARLKEEYRELKMWVNENAAQLAIAIEGVNGRLEKCEDLFSSSEEWLYANDFMRAQDDLSEIEKILKELNSALPELPDIIKDAKGVVPVMQDELSRQYALSRQRGIYLDHLQIEKRLEDIRNDLNTQLKAISHIELAGVFEALAAIKASLKEMLESLEDETVKHAKNKVLVESLNTALSELKRLENYVRLSFEKDREKYGLQDLEEFLNSEHERIGSYVADSISLNNDLSANTSPSSKIYDAYTGLLQKVNDDIKLASGYKLRIDKNSSDEERARNQLMKLQIVLNEVEVKVREYRLPTIANSYHDDLLQGREKIKAIRDLLNEIPLNLEALNKTLDEAISYIYTFYNNVNNVVGMAIMVEDAIVLANKYRSTHVEVDRDLSKAEFSYLNGEYTKAFKIAIGCMESLFPNRADEKIMENAGA